MKSEMPGYEDYKDSEVEWIGQTPVEWRVTRNKDIFEERGALSEAGSETLLTVSHITGVTRRSEKNVNMFMAETMEGYKLCKQGDLIINTMWAWMGALGTSNEDGICSPAYGVYKPKKNKPYYFRYFDYLYRTPNAIIEMKRNSKGIVSSRLRLYPKEFFQIKTALPGYAIQKTIADYLDAKTSQIDRKIDLFNQKAILYDKLKQSLINETVTRGLNKTVAMKDSEIEWIGKVPAHWGMKRLKDTFKAIKGKSLEFSSVQEEKYLPNLSLEYLRNNSIPHIDYSYSENAMNKASSKDIIIIWDGAGVGEILRAKEGFLSSTIAKLEFYDIEEKEFIYHMRYHIESKVKKIPTGMGIPHLNPDILYNFVIPIPPKNERQAIIDYLNVKCVHIDRIVENINVQIDNLKELRKTLINDVVTGKIKVTGREKSL